MQDMIVGKRPKKGDVSLLHIPPIAILFNSTADTSPSHPLPSPQPHFHHRFLWDIVNNSDSGIDVDK